MKRFIFTFLILLLTISCISKMPASYTPTTRQQYILTDVQNGIGTLQLAAENAVPANILRLSTARLIVQFCVTANQTIIQTPNGWYATVNTAYQSLKKQIPQNDIDNFGYAFDAFELVLNSFSGVR